MEKRGVQAVLGETAKDAVLHPWTGLIRSVIIRTETEISCCDLNTLPRLDLPGSSDWEVLADHRHRTIGYDCRAKPHIPTYNYRAQLQTSVFLLESRMKHQRSFLLSGIDHFYPGSVLA